MRLKPDEIAAIKAAAREAFGADAVVRLFGSRVHDHLRGGDIDLHIELPQPETGPRGEIPFRVALWRDLNVDDVDVVVHVGGQPLRWVDKAALRTGVVL